MFFLKNIFWLILLAVSSSSWATTQIEIRDNPVLSSSVADLSSVRARSGGRPEPIIVRDISTEDLRYAIVPVYEDNKRNENVSGTAFIVSDSRMDSLLDHRNYLPFNYQFDSSKPAKTPRLYLVSNAHVLKYPPDTGVNFYTFEFHFVKRAETERGGNDFKVVRTSIPVAELHIITHPGDDGREVDLSYFPLNRVFDLIHTEPSLADYTPAFTAFDTQWHFANHTVGNSGIPIRMYGFPDGEADRAKNFPVLTAGRCSTDPKTLDCEPTKPKILDFKMDITDIGGSSGSPVIVHDDFAGADRLLGVNWGGNFLDAAVALDSDDDLDSDDSVDEARLKERVDGAEVSGTAGDNIGYAVHASRLKEMIEDDAFPAHAALTLAPANVLAPPPPAYTVDEPQRLNPTPGRLADILPRLAAGPSILNLSGHNITVEGLPDVIASILAAPSYPNIVSLNLSSNRIMYLNYGMFEPLLSQVSFRYLDVRQNPNNNILEFYKEAETHGFNNKIISAERGADYSRIRSMADVPLSPDAHKAYYRQYERK